MKIPVTAIVLTYNEEKNIGSCLDSFYKHVNQVIVVDSGSTDATKDIVQEYNGVIWLTHHFENYAKQRNWSLENAPIKEEWVLNIDADHRVTPELIADLNDFFTNKSSLHYNGIMVSRRTIFMGRWIKFGGHYPVYHAVLFKKGFGYCEHKKYDQHFVVNGPIKILKSDVIDIITDSLHTFTSRHNNWSKLEAEYIIEKKDLSKEVTPDSFGNPMQKRRKLRHTYYNAPLFWRVFLYFTYRYVFRLGFLDGKQGLIFHFLQGFWFRFLVDAKIYELIKAKSTKLS